MSGHATAGPVKGSQAVLERIQVTVMPGQTAKQPVVVALSAPVVPEKGAEPTVSLASKALPIGDERFEFKKTKQNT